MGRIVFLKILGGIAILMMLSLAAAVFWTRYAPVENDREPASMQDDRILIDQGEVAATDVYGKTAVSGALRARQVVFNSFELGRAIQAEKTLNLDLFPDKSVRIQLQNPSKFTVNDRLLVGQIAGDPESQVRLQIAGDAMDAQIQGSRNEYRIVPMGSGVHWVIEIKTKSSN